MKCVRWLIHMQRRCPLSDFSQLFLQDSWEKISTTLKKHLTILHVLFEITTRWRTSLEEQKWSGFYFINWSLKHLPHLYLMFASKTCTVESLSNDTVSMTSLTALWNSVTLPRTWRKWTVWFTEIRQTKKNSLGSLYLKTTYVNVSKVR